jgi:acyl-CoA reductase-like NAD-dependent aldehyde dehydrogenase
VLPDANLDVAVRESVLGSLSFNGQRCTAIKIIFVHKTIREAFLKKFVEAVDKLKVNSFTSSRSDHSYLLFLFLLVGIALGGRSGHHPIA